MRALVRILPPVRRCDLEHSIWRGLSCLNTDTQACSRDASEGKAPSTQAGEFVREEMEHIREANTLDPPSKRLPLVFEGDEPASNCPRPNPARLVLDAQTGEARHPTRTSASRRRLRQRFARDAARLEKGKPIRRLASGAVHAGQRAARKHSPARGPNKLRAACTRRANRMSRGGSK